MGKKIKMIFKFYYYEVYYAYILCFREYKVEATECPENSPQLRCNFEMQV